ncbi:hypothetical protein [Mycoplasmopsis iners]|uniref:hypothetical protein n=1 Tax=Mycoplasmopsis iners TaxID=76630 RepID=UPI00068A6766|nr:hypothetical protein [Mycoplasmopsis iners]
MINSLLEDLELPEELSNIINEFTNTLGSDSESIVDAVRGNSEYTRRLEEYSAKRKVYSVNNSTLKDRKALLASVEKDITSLDEILADDSSSKADYEIYLAIESEKDKLYAQQSSERKALTIIGAEEPENADSTHEVDNLRYKLNKLISDYYQNDEVIKKFQDYLNQLKEATSSVQTAASAYDSAKETEGLDAELQSFNDKIDELNSMVGNYGEILKEKATLKTAKMLNEEDGTYFDTIIENAQIDAGDYEEQVPEKLKEYVSNIDQQIAKIDEKINSVSALFVELKQFDSVLDQKYENLKQTREAYLIELQNLYKEAVLKGYAYISQDQLRNEDVRDEILKLGIKIYNINAALYALSGIKEKIDTYRTKFQNIEEEFNKLSNSEEIQNSLNAYETALKEYLTDEKVKEEKAGDILSILFSSLIEADLEAAEAEGPYGELQDLDEEIEAMESEEGYEEYQEKVARRDALREEAQPLIDKYYILNQIKEGLEDKATEMSQALAFEFEEDDENASEYQAANDKLDKAFEAQGAYEQAVSTIATLVEEYKAYSALLAQYYNYPDKLIKQYRDTITFSAENILKIRNADLLKESKQLSLVDNADLGKKLTTADDLIIAKSRMELIDILTKKGVLALDATNEEIDKVIRKMELTNVNKVNTQLVVTLREVRKVGEKSFDENFTQNYLKFNVDANNKDRKIIDAVNDLFKLIGHKRVVMPSLLKEEGNVKDIKTGKLVKGYSIYSDAYQDLLNTLVEEVPYAAEWLNGEHLVAKVNDQGVMEYVVENGEYLGFSRDTRIGLWAILKMSDPNFKGVPTDFLKFVAAHEYGHHFTLNAASDLGDKGDDAIFVSALLPGASPQITSFYNKKNLELYLAARTNLKLNTDRLLDGTYVAADFGEYPVFKLPKVNESGELVYEPEKEANIWGTELYEDDIVKAMKNQKRRFLQTFDGLKTALNDIKEENGLTGDNENKLKLYDLWIMNALDQYSGTINPTVSNGIAKYLVKEEDGSYTFKPGSLEILKGQIKDGQGNEIAFETDSKGNLQPKIVEGEKDSNGNYVLITKVLVKNADGTWIINVPLNQRFGSPNDPYYDADAVKYVNDQINKVTKTIKQLIVEKFSINGWNTPSSDLSIESKFILDWAERGLIFEAGGEKYNDKANNAYRDMVLARNPETGAPVSTTNRFTLYTAYNDDGTINVSQTNAIRNYNIYTSNLYFTPSIYKLASFNNNEFSRAMFAMSRAGSRLNNPVNGGNGYVMFLDKQHQYMPNVKYAGVSDYILKSDAWGKDFLDQLGIKLNLKSMNEVQKLAMGLADTALWITYGENDAVLEKDPNVVGQYPDWSSVAKLKINTRALGATIHNNLFNLFGNDEIGRGSEIQFSDMAKFAEFVSLDFKQARLDKVNKRVNWNIDYAKTKVSDFEAFKQALANAINANKSLSDKEKEEYLAIANSNDEQIIANEIMRRFGESKLAPYTSHLTIQDIIDNNDYAWIFDQTYGYGDYKIAGLNLIKPDVAKWEISLETYLSMYQELAEQFKYVASNNEEFKPTMAQFSIYDALIGTGKYQSYTSLNDVELTLGKATFINVWSAVFTAKPKTSRPSDDVVSYYGSKNDRKYNEKFSDYTFSWAEIINRDNLQITYSPSMDQFGNLPSYLTGLSEANTGLEYVVDGSPTQKWLDKALSFDRGDTRGSIKKSISEYESNLNVEAQDKARNLNIKYVAPIFANEKDFIDGYNYNSSFFGQFRSINNGWLKDRWYREILDFKLYDDKGKPIVSENIAIENLKGEKVQNLPEAYWQFYIQAQGVGKRELSNIWRNSDLDAVAMFGYLPSDVADKAKYLAFKDLETGEIKTTAVNQNNTNNMFYYKEQRLDNEANYEKYLETGEGENPRHTLADEEYNYTDSFGNKHQGKGFVAWVTDYVVMSKYRNKLLTPGHKYYVYFASNEKGDFAMELDLGNVESVSENGKTFKQAPVTIEKAKDNQFGEKYNGKAIAVIKDQFNGIIG